MKPNGRRRFRKMNARFRQRGSAVVRERARSTSAGKARKLILNDFWGGDPLPLPPPVFSPRSLVGMTRGARKRLRDRVVWGTRHDGIEPQVLRMAHAAECSVSEVLGLPEMGMAGDAGDKETQ